MASDPLGDVSDRHLHVQVHSYGEAIQVAEGSRIDHTGILPADLSPRGEDIVAPYLYDVMQFLPGLREMVGQNVLTLTSNGGEATLPLSNCSRKYITDLPSLNTALNAVEVGNYDYRGLIIYQAPPPLPSPLITTIHSTPAN